MTDIQSFAASVQNFLDAMERSAPVKPTSVPWVYKALRDHLQAEPESLPILSFALETYEHPNLEMALQEWFAEIASSGGAVHVEGIASSESWVHPSLTSLAKGSYCFGKAPIERTRFAVPGRDGVMVGSNALYLVSIDHERYALMVTIADHGSVLLLQIIGTTHDSCQQHIDQLQERANRLNIYRGQMLTVGCKSVTFASLPPIHRDQIILPQHTLELIDRQTIAFSAAAERLKASGMHLKRGILLYGPPGTGKTLTSMYLASRMPGRTIILCAGLDYAAVSRACDLARELAPSTVILEDVDLIAQDRSNSQCASMLHELMNQMDGLHADCDVLFVLTTNRPAAIEQAISSRPGRIDQAIEVPHPDAECRRRLLTLYSAQVRTALVDLQTHVARTEGVSATFMRELVRRACLICYAGGPDDTVRDEHISQAIDEMRGDILQSRPTAHSGADPRVTDHDLALAATSPLNTNDLATSRSD